MLFSDATVAYLLLHDWQTLMLLPLLLDGHAHLALCHSAPAAEHSQAGAHTSSTQQQQNYEASMLSSPSFGILYGSAGSINRKLFTSLSRCF